MSEEQLYSVSSSPHVHSGASIHGIMRDVVIAMVPTFIAAIIFFGLNALILTATCVISCVFFEYLSRRIMKRNNTINDLSAVITGVLLAFNLPPTFPIWMAVVGSFVAIVIAKQLFGGLGYNPFNPALAGRLFLFLSFAFAMSGDWTPWSYINTENIVATTSATPLGMLQESTGSIAFLSNNSNIMNMFLGKVNGCIGEVSALALILGGLYLLWRKVITWHIPVAYIGTVAVFATILYMIDPSTNASPLFHLFSGGLMLGAIFMATDMVTSPTDRSGMLVFGIGCGLLTMIIRKWGAYPEGVSFSIFIMNATTPLINRVCKPRVFGVKGKA
ncbi:MAG: RnfABCDGE type electron transport complex subunit D [Kiritimatiellae bacterium]|jgi:electron transport complex protein RnfD|nr:RnfABCDGE type electron transport complex subunit D [Kiritimatiellia bacterium]